MLNQATLKKIADDCAQKIRDCKTSGQYTAEPFQHFQIDNFFPEALANACLDNFPALTESGWHHTNDIGIEVKSRSTWASEFDIPDGLVDAVRILNSAQFLKAIGDILDIPKLMPDPYFAGGGLNCTRSGGLLDIHVDGNYHDASGMHRRVNALLYLNKNWKEGWGGEFGIYSDHGEKLVKQIPPLFNRLVVFDTHDHSYHGLPNPITFPEGEDRKSIILYYYTVKERPQSLVTEQNPHSALWKKNGFTDKNGSKTRKYS